MFNAADIHPLTGKYKHIIIPPGVKKLKVTMKDGKGEQQIEPRRRDKVRLPYPRYRDAER